MKLSKLLTYSFAPNVGTIDRLARIVSGLAIAILPWTSWVAAPSAIAIALSAFGVAWLITGLVSRCGLYYLLGKSTRAESN